MTDTTVKKGIPMTAKRGRFSYRYAIVTDDGAHIVDQTGRVYIFGNRQDAETELPKFTNKTFVIKRIKVQELWRVSR